MAILPVNQPKTNMKPYFLLSALLTLLSFQAPALANNASNTPPGRYCNPRYNFCLMYPEAVFTEKHSSSNDDGIVLMSTDRDVILRVAGYYNIMGWSPEEEMADFQSALQEQFKEKLELITQHSTEEGLEATFKAGHISIYCLIVAHGDSFVCLEMRTNLKKKFDPSHAIPMLLEDVKLEHVE